MCPNCNEIVRLSDLQLRAKGKAPRTWLDDYQASVEKADEKQSKFEEERENIMEEARERGRAQVPELVRQSLSDEFAKLHYNPYDIKALLNPIDFVVFDGMTDEEMKNVVLLTKSTTNSHLQAIHNDIARTVEDKNYDWKVVRVSTDGQVEIE